MRKILFLLFKILNFEMRRISKDQKNLKKIYKLEQINKMFQKVSFKKNLKTLNMKIR